MDLRARYGDRRRPPAQPATAQQLADVEAELLRLGATESEIQATLNAFEDIDPNIIADQLAFLETLEPEPAPIVEVIEEPPPPDPIVEVVIEEPPPPAPEPIVTSTSLALVVAPTTGSLSVQAWADAAFTTTIVGATVSAGGRSEVTNFAGVALITGLLPGTYVLTGSAAGHEDGAATFTVRAGETTNGWLVMPPLVVTLTGSMVFGVRAGGGPARGANVRFAGRLLITNTFGSATFRDVPEGPHDYSVELAGFQPAVGTATVVAGVQRSTGISMLDVVTIPAPTTGVMRFLVRDSALFPAAGAAVAFAGRSGFTDSGGSLIFADIPAGTYGYTVALAGHLQATGNATVIAGEGRFAPVDLVEVPPTVPPPPPLDGVTQYTVVDGDTLGSIAADFGVPLAELIAVNPQIVDPDLIFPGQVINIPSLVVTQTGTVRFVVQDAATNAALAGAFVQYAGRSDFTDLSGRVTFDQVTGGVALPYTVSRSDYASVDGVATAIAGGVVTVSARLEQSAVPSQLAQLLVLVSDRDVAPLAGATVTFRGVTRLTDEGGVAAFEELQPLTEGFNVPPPEPVTVTAEGFLPATVTVAILADTVRSVPFALSPSTMPATFTVFGVDSGQPPFPLVVGARVAISGLPALFTDELGQVVFENVPVEVPLERSVTAAGFAPGIAPLELIAWPAQPPLIEVELFPVGTTPPPGGDGDGDGTVPIPEGARTSAAVLAGVAAGAAALLVIGRRRQRQAAPLEVS